MRYHLTKLAPATLLAFAAVGCRDSARDVTANESLQRDLELAQASAVSLAAPRDLPATRFVSALEGGERATAGRGSAAHPATHAPTKAPHARTSHAPPAPSTVASHAGAAAASTETADAPAPASTTVASDAGTTAAPSSSGGPSSDGVISVSPTDAPGGSSGTETGRRGHGRGIGGIFGGIIGVVIRGGGIGDDDHCERDHPGARGGRYPTSGGYPVGFPSGTYPQGGTIGVPASGVGRVGRPRY